MSTTNFSSATFDYHKMLYVNLKLICQVFPDTEMAKGNIEPDMFKKSNTKAMHTIFYSLINILDQEKCRSMLPWPAAFKADSYKFRAGVLKFIEEEFYGFHIPKLASSLINSASGDKFVQFLFHFCLYATKLIIQKYYGTAVLEIPEIITPECKRILYELQSQALDDENKSANSYQDFLSLAEQKSKCLSDELETVTLEVNKTNEDLQKVVDDLKNCSNSTKQLLLDMNNQDGLLEWTENIKSLKKEASGLEREIKENFEKLHNIYELVQFLNCMSKIKLDANDIKINISEYILNLMNIKFEQVPESICVNGKLSLEKLLQFGHAFASKHVERIAELEPPKNYCEINEALKTKINSALSNLNRFQSLDSELASRIREMQTNLIHDKKESNIYTNFEYDIDLMDNFVCSSDSLFNISMSNYVANPLMNILDIPLETGLNLKNTCGDKKAKHLSSTEKTKLDETGESVKSVNWSQLVSSTPF